MFVDFNLELINHLKYYKLRISKLYVVLFVALMLGACKPYYYQVYQVTPSTEITFEQNALVYEDENCEVVYNLWSEGGNIGFSFYNKTDHDIYLNKEKSFFILNGLAQDYYKDRVFSSGNTMGTSVSKGASASSSVSGFNFFNLFQTNMGQVSKEASIMNSFASSVAFNEQKVVCIPSKTLKYIDEYKITEMLYRDCDILRFPRRNNVQTKSFDINDTPLVFSNRIAYTVGDSDELINFENEFYISQVSNYHEKNITTEEYSEFCGEKSKERTRFFKNVSPDKFYIKYDKGFDAMKH